MAVKNSTILHKIWLNATNDYQQRVPDPTQHDISQTMKALFSPMNGKLYNEFIYGFINLIGQQRIHSKQWDNRLRRFKQTSVMYGQTIQESAPKWIEAHAYDDASEDLLRMHRPEFEVWYHSMNRQDKYAISIVRPEIMRAFRDEYGLNRLINSIMQVPINSDNYDEYRIMIQLLAEYEERWGFFKESMPIPTDEESAKALLKSIRAYAETLQFPSALYNASDVSVPTFANPNELVLFITPQVKASLDVDALAAVFNLDKADIPYTIIVIDEMPIPNAYALLTTDAFYVCQDVVYETTQFYDPSNLRENHYLHHWEILSVSPFVPAILFTTATGTSIPTVTQSVTGMSLTAAPTTVVPGETVQITPTLAGSITPETEGIEVAPDAATYEVSAYTPGTPATETTDATPDVPIQLNTRTYVDRLGVLHTQKSNLKAGDVITVKADATYTNPSGATSPYTASVNVTVVDPD